MSEQNDSTGQRWEYFAVDAKPYDHDSEVEIGWLNEHGRDGWALAGVAPLADFPGWMRYYFRRPTAMAPVVESPLVRDAITSAIATEREACAQQHAEDWAEIMTMRARVAELEAHNLRLRTAADDAEDALRDLATFGELDADRIAEQRRALSAAVDATASTPPSSR